MDFMAIQKEAMSRASAPAIGSSLAQQPQIDTVDNVVQLIIQRAQELRERAASVSNAIAGPDNGAQVGADFAPSLVGVLQSISMHLSAALSSIERAQRAL